MRGSWVIEVFLETGKVLDGVGFGWYEGKGKGKFADVGFDGNFPEGNYAAKNSGGCFNLGAGGGLGAEDHFRETR
jgi:hypothetical protein